MTSQEKKTVNSFSFAPIVKGSLFGIFMMLTAVFIEAILMLNQVIPLECLAQTATAAVSVGFLSAAFVTSASAKSKKMICGVAACASMAVIFVLLGIIMPGSTFSVPGLVCMLIAAAVCSIIGSMLAALIKKK